MAPHLESLSGEQLLLVSVLGRPADRAAVQRELDRRALFGPPRRRRLRAARVSARMVYRDAAGVAA